MNIPDRSVPSSARLFLALWPDPATRRLLQERRDAWGWPKGATLVAADKLHLTLHFLGSQPGERMQEFLDGFSVPFAPFRFELATATVWHNGIAVLEPGQAPPELLALHARLAEALVALGLHPESRPYRPHVTMARRANGAGLPSSGPPIAWDVRGYALVESKNGAYTVLRDYA